LRQEAYVAVRQVHREREKKTGERKKDGRGQEEYRFMGGAGRRAGIGIEAMRATFLRIHSLQKADTDRATSKREERMSYDGYIYEQSVLLHASHAGFYP